MGGVSDVRERAASPQRAGVAASDLTVSKLLRPLVRADTVHRSLLADRLARDDARPIVSVVAPAGYGKTTLLAQWAERGGQAVALVSVDEKDKAQNVVLPYGAKEQNTVKPVPHR